MGAICEPCYSEEISVENQIQYKTVNIEGKSQLKGVKLSLSNESLIKFHTECLVVYVDHCSELTNSQLIRNLTNRIKRKLFEYISLAEEETEKRSQTHFLIPMTIPNFQFKYLLFVKMKPWDGKEVQELEKKLYNLSKSYLEVFELRKIKTFTIIEPDDCLGIHYGIFYQSISKCIKEYVKSIKKVVIVFNSPESLEYFAENINRSNEEIKESENKLELKNNKSEMTESNKKDKKKLLRENEDVVTK